MCINILDIVKKGDATVSQIKKYCKFAVPDVVSGLPSIHSSLCSTNTMLHLFGVVKFSISHALFERIIS